MILTELTVIYVRPSFQSYEQPFSILVADLSSPNGDPSTIVSAGGNLIPLTNPLFEINVCELNSSTVMFGRIVYNEVTT